MELRLKASRDPFRGPLPSTTTERKKTAEDNSEVSLQPSKCFPGTFFSHPVSRSTHPPPRTKSYDETVLETVGKAAPSPLPCSGLPMQAGAQAASFVGLLRCVSPRGLLGTEQPSGTLSKKARRRVGVCHASRSARSLSRRGFLDMRAMRQLSPRRAGCAAPLEVAFPATDTFWHGLDSRQEAQAAGSGSSLSRAWHRQSALPAASPPAARRNRIS